MSWTLAAVLAGVLLAWMVLEFRKGRADGVYIGTNPARRMMFYIMPTRTESQCFFDVWFDATELMAYLEEAKPRFGANVTHAVVAAAEIGLATNPRMNRFVAGKRLYQRKGRFVTFSMKRKVVGGGVDYKARLATVKLETSKPRTFRDLCEEINASITVNRSGRKTYADKEFQLFDVLPRPLLSFFARALMRLDYYGLIPGSFIANDPLYTSMFVANLGSIGMDSTFHHLFEYGTCHIFLAIGRVKEHVELRDGVPVAVPRIHLRYTYDERADDGINCRHGFTAMTRVLEDPRRWLGCLAEDGSDARPFWPREDWGSEDGTYACRE